MDNEIYTEDNIPTYLPCNDILSSIACERVNAYGFTNIEKLTQNCYSVTHPRMKISTKKFLIGCNDQQMILDIKVASIQPKYIYQKPAKQKKTYLQRLCHCLHNAIYEIYNPYEKLEQIHKEAALDQIKFFTGNLDNDIILSIQMDADKKLEEIKLHSIYISENIFCYSFSFDPEKDIERTLEKISEFANSTKQNYLVNISIPSN